MILTIYGTVIFIDLNKSVSNQDFIKLLKKTSNGAYEVKKETEAAKALQEKKVRSIKGIYEDMHQIPTRLYMRKRYGAKKNSPKRRLMGIAGDNDFRL